MINVVLRHPEVPQPLVLAVGDDGVVPYSYKTSGWDIDNTTPVDEALAEIEKHRETAAQPPEEPVTPHFEQIEGETDAQAAVAEPVVDPPVVDPPVVDPPVVDPAPGQPTLDPPVAEPDLGLPAADPFTPPVTDPGPAATSTSFRRR